MSCTREAAQTHVRVPPIELPLAAHGGVLARPLDAVDEEKDVKRGTRYRSVRQKKKVTAVEMPAREPTTHSSCTATRKVRLYQASTSTLYLSEHGLEWFVG